MDLREYFMMDGGKDVWSEEEGKEAKLVGECN